MEAINSLELAHCAEILPQFCVRATGPKPGVLRRHYPTLQNLAVTCGSAHLLTDYETVGSNPPLSSRRQGLLSRAPSRQQIAALMNRLPSCDEWLDDKYDEEF